MTDPEFEELSGAKLALANDIYASIYFSSSAVDDTTYALFEDGALIALSRLKRHADGTLELGGVWVHAHHRSRGLARRIVRHVLEQAPRSAPVWCIAFVHLVPFYRSLGLHDAGARNVPDSLSAKMGACRSQRAAGEFAHDVQLLVREVEQVETG